MTILDQMTEAGKTVFGGAMGGLLAREAYVTSSGLEASIAVGVYGVLLFLFATFVYWGIEHIAGKTDPSNDDDGEESDPAQVAS